jgi:PAS domain S-box-containing protein
VREKGGVVIAKRWLYTLGALLAIDLVIALTLRPGELHRVFQGHHDGRGVLALVGLACLIGVLAAAAAVARSLLSASGALYRQDQSIAAAASTTHDWLWEANADHVLTYCSRGVQELLGYPPEELVGHSPLGFLAEEDRKRSAAIMRNAIISGAGWEGVEGQWRHRDGHLVALEGNAALIRDRSGRITGSRGTRRPVTASVRAERLSAAAHDRVQAVLATAEIDVALQPIVNLYTGQLAGVEALARFRDGRGPDVWFAEARQTGLSRQLEQLAFTAALGTFSTLPADCYLSVNASPALIRAPGFTSRLLDTKVPLERLVVEITEHEAIDDYDVLNGALTGLREAGVRLAVDDTGAGYASLSHVLQLRPDIIKIDRSLIAQLGSDPARRSLVTALVLLALDIGAAVTGEGVENHGELDTLATLGVDYAQGYLLAKPTTDPAIWQSWSRRDWLATEPRHPHSADGQAASAAEQAGPG